MFRAMIQSLVVAIALTFAVGAARADNPSMVIDDQGRAVGGYDTVAYFTEGEAIPGKPEFSHNWQGATWLFASAAHRDAFAADPKAYAPQFGGYCAYAISTNHAIKARPEVWSIHQGKLYLNLGPGAQKKWEKDVPGNVAKAVNNWPGALTDPGKGKANAESNDR